MQEQYGEEDEPWPEEESAPAAKPRRESKPKDNPHVPPQDLAAEQAVLGSMMLSKDAIDEVMDILKPGQHYRPAHELIHNAILDLYNRGEPADPITVASELVKRSEITRIGGPSYLHTLVNAVPTAANAGYYAEIVLECAHLRAVIGSGTRLVQMASGDPDKVRDVIDAAAAELLSLTASFDLGRDPDGWDTPMEEILSDWEDDQASGPKPGLPMPYAEVGEKLGVEPGHLIVVAGRPGMGKSVVLLDIVRHLSVVHGRSAAFVSLEMMKRQLMHRLVSAEASININDVRKHQMDAAAWKRYDEARGRIVDAPLRLVVPKGGTTIAQLRAHLRRWSVDGRLPDVLALDYLQIVRAEKAAASFNRTNQVDEIARGLKELALEFELPIITAAQLSRQTTSRDNKVPQLSDLRESGEIEQAADAVVLLHRDDYYEPAAARADEMDLIIAKNRNGNTATCTVVWQGRFSRAIDFGTV
jgi:replicative DNA helicase